MFKPVNQICSNIALALCCVFSAGLLTAQAQTDTAPVLFVRKNGTGTDPKTDPNVCNPKDASGNNTERASFDKALRTIRQAVECAVKAKDHVTIMVLCEEPKGQCVHTSSPLFGTPSLPLDNIFPENVNQRKITFRGEPQREVVIKVPFTPGNGSNKHPEISFRSNWVVRGFVFDGSGGDDLSKEGGSFVRLMGSDIEFTDNEVKSTPYNCVGVGFFSNEVDQSSNVTVRNNIIHDCRDSGGVKDRHCVFTEKANSLMVAYNDIYNCSGDGFQVENYLPSQSGPMPQHPTAAENVKVIGNRIRAMPCISPGRSIGENAIDIKRAGRGLLIQDNLIWGYRAYNPTWVNKDCMGTGDGGSHGDGIVVHGRLDQNNNVPCTTAPCAIIEGNDIGDSESGITVGSNPDSGAPLGVRVRGNYIHDLRGKDTNSNEPSRKGSAFNLTTDATPSPGLENRVYRNTIVNAPGRSIFTADSNAFTLRNNLFQELGNCSGPQVNPQGKPDYGMASSPPSNYFVNAPGNAGWLSGLPAITFRGAAGPTPTPPWDCGHQPPPPATPDKYLGLPYDYRLSIASPPPAAEFLNQGGNDPDFGDRHTEMQGINGTFYDKSADEHQTKEETLKIYLRDGPPSATPPISDPSAEEEYREAEWWHSPDIGILLNGTQEPTLSLLSTPDDEPLVVANPVFSRDASNPNASNDPWILVRVMHDPSLGAMQAPKNIHVRIWGAPLHTELTFPATFTEYVKEDVVWNGANEGKDASNNVIWKVMGRRATSHIYAFPFKVLGSQNLASKALLYRNLEHFCIRAWISTDKDRRPPFFLPVKRSNNMAQRNVLIERQPVVMPTFISYIDSPERTGGNRIIHFTKTTNRPAFFYEPLSPTQVWVDDDKCFDTTSRRCEDSFPPKVGRLVPLEKGDNTVTIDVSPTALKVWQIIVDSRQLGPPSPSESITVRQGQGGFTINLNTAGFRESFEWGIPAAWTRTGFWRPADLFEDPSCGSSRIGRKAAAFNASARKCTYEKPKQSKWPFLNKIFEIFKIRSRVRGQLISPPFDVPDVEGTVRLSFYHWSETDKRPGRDIRRVSISVNGGPFQELAQWSTPDHGSRDNWVYQHFDISAHKGSRIRVAFTFDSVDRKKNKHQGWYVDDVEVESF